MGGSMSISEIILIYFMYIVYIVYILYIFVENTKDYGNNRTTEEKKKH